jgi:pimeloyl-ACP methyl ester carboxylesterase
MLLIHGLAGSSRHWSQTSVALADLCSLYAPDLPGHGATPARPARQDPDGLATLIIGFADRLGLERFDLTGHSWGAAVAILVAAGWPDRVRRLVLTGLGVARNGFEQAAMTHVHGQMRVWMSLWRPWLAMAQPWVDSARPLFAGWWDHPSVYRAVARRAVRHLPDDETVRRGVADALATDPLTALETVIDAGSPIFQKALARVVAPTLVVHADRDPLMPTSGVQALAEHIRDVRRIEITDCGHLPMIERPDQYHGALRAFLTDPCVDGAPHA